MLAFSPDGKRFATAGSDKPNEGTGDEPPEHAVEVLVWNLATGKVKESAPGLTTPVNALAFSRDGRTLAIAVGHMPRLSPKPGRMETQGEIRLWPVK